MSQSSVFFLLWLCIPNGVLSLIRSSCFKADDHLVGASNGAFVVRNDLTSEQTLIMTYVADGNLVDFKLQNTAVCVEVYGSIRYIIPFSLQKGLRMESSRNYFRTLNELVHHYSLKTEEIPYPLIYDSSQHNDGNPLRVGRDDHKSAYWFDSSWCQDNHILIN